MSCPSEYREVKEEEVSCLWTQNPFHTQLECSVFNHLYRDFFFLVMGRNWYLQVPAPLKSIQVIILASISSQAALTMYQHTTWWVINAVFHFALVPSLTGSSSCGLILWMARRNTPKVSLRNKRLSSALVCEGWALQNVSAVRAVQTIIRLFVRNSLSKFINH